MTHSTEDRCWICLGPGGSREHILKKSDLKAVFEPLSSRMRLSMKADDGERTLLQSLNADRLKFERKICLQCNITRTQPHDRAWERLSRYLRETRPKTGSLVRASTIFPRDSRQQLLNVHLYFSKIFGNAVADADEKFRSERIEIDIGAYAAAIQTGVAHPDFYLIFGRIPGFEGKRAAEVSALQVIENRPFWMLCYRLYVTGAAAALMVHAPGEDLGSIVSAAWHPRYGRSSFRLIDLTQPETLISRARFRQAHRAGGAGDRHR